MPIQKKRKRYNQITYRNYLNTFIKDQTYPFRPHGARTDFLAYVWALFPTSFYKSSLGVFFAIWIAKGIRNADIWQAISGVFSRSIASNFLTTPALQAQLCDGHYRRPLLPAFGASGLATQLHVGWVAHTPVCYSIHLGKKV